MEQEVTKRKLIKNSLCRELNQQMEKQIVIILKENLSIMSRIKNQVFSTHRIIKFLKTFFQQNEETNETEPQYIRQAESLYNDGGKFENSLLD